jgi:amino acid permease
LYKKTTLKGSQLLFVFVIYFLAVVCGVLIFLSFSLGDDKFFGIILSSIGLIVFAFVPTYYLIKNKAPKVDEIDNGYEVNF